MLSGLEAIRDSIVGVKGVAGGCGRSGVGDAVGERVDWMRSEVGGSRIVDTVLLGTGSGAIVLLSPS